MRPLPLLWILAAAAVLGSANTSRAPQQRGSILFTKTWTEREGLGPRFNATSCASCHAGATSSTSEEPVFVLVASSQHDPAGGRLFRRFRIGRNGAVEPAATPGVHARRRAPPLGGVGLLERAIFSAARPSGNDIRNDGVSDARTGRFGWKARFATLEQAIAAALVGEMGLTTTRFPHDGSPTTAGGPEIGDNELAALIGFVRALAPPAPLPRPAPPAYTDLALHDLGPALSDGIAEGNATARQFRTPPLWGLGRRPPAYLHDGRARTLHDAIVAHGGDARQVTARYQELSESDRQVLLAFLRSL